MKITRIVLVLMITVVVVLGLTDFLSPSLTGNLVGVQVVLLVCIPISLALFAFLGQRHKEPPQGEKKEGP